MRHRIAAGIAALAVAGSLTAAAYPDRDRMDSVRRYVAQRAGAVGVAVIDTRGQLRGIHGRRLFVGASVTKAMLLVAYLRRVDSEGRGLTAQERRRLRRMIRVSSNSAATWTYQRLGEARLWRLARRADMDHFSICCSWGYARFSARDQAKFFWRLEKLTPRPFRPYATRLLGSIVARQSWGIPSVARPRGFSVFFKGGWRRLDGGRLVHQAAFIRYGETAFSLAVLTDGNPSTRYGIATIAGIARRLLRDPPSQPSGRVRAAG